MTNGDERITVTKLIAAPPSAIFEVIVSPLRHPDIDGSGMLTSADEQPALTMVGDAFQIGMHQDAYGDYRMENHVTVFEPNTALEWRPQVVGGPGSGVVYGYVLSPTGDGTEVESYYDWSGIAQERKDAGFKPVVSAEHMTQTLANLASIVEAGT